ncbi:hypothetical protein X798_01835 [Onchocerca flexuosa]|uniref:Chondroitin proteoglycan 4 domain-containing protein n=1 Tax=Onchocerca flexuosa TaxID=387005 RepID=A0A238C0M5_9BILA|nr:hypothetical protein X798_01835 [Onchocerca flexuosa]
MRGLIFSGAYMNDYHVFDFLESLQLLDCLQICLGEVASVIEQPFAGQQSVHEIGNICCHFDVFQRCLHHDTSCKDAPLGVTTATSIISVQSIRNDFDIYSATPCFNTCIQNIDEKECSIGRSTLLHKIIAAVVNHTIKVNPSPEIKSSDAYTLLMSSVLPNECQRLKLLPQYVIFATPKTDFVDDTANSKENDAIRTILTNHGQNQTNSIYVKILPLNGHYMKFQCQMIDLETGQEVTVADVTTLMTTVARVSCGSKLTMYRLTVNITIL